MLRRKILMYCRACNATDIWLAWCSVTFELEGGESISSFLSDIDGFYQLPPWQLSASDCLLRLRAQQESKTLILLLANGGKNTFSGNTDFCELGLRETRWSPTHCCWLQWNAWTPISQLRDSGMFWFENWGAFAFGSSLGRGSERSRTHESESSGDVI